MMISPNVERAMEGFAGAMESFLQTFHCTGSSTRLKVSKHSLMEETTRSGFYRSGAMRFQASLLAIPILLGIDASNAKLR